jgi:metal-responsive CopG/Arc/MetJ family transcriptional regulator
MKPKLLNLISVRLPDDLLKKIDAKCEANSISRSNLFRAAIEDRLERDTKTDLEENDVRPTR